MAAGRTVDPTARFGGGPGPDRRELLEAPVHWPDPVGLGARLSTLKGIGPVLERNALEVGVGTVFDLLWRLPADYGEPPVRRTLDSLPEDEPVAVEVEVVERRRVRPGRRAVVEAKVRDRGASMRAVWFNRPWVFDRIGPGDRLVLEGRLSGESFVVATHREAGAPEPSGPRPRYGSAGEVSPGRWASWSGEALERAGIAPDPLPACTRTRLGLPGGPAALAEAHRPRSFETAWQARSRLAFEELFLHQVMVLARGARERQAAGAALRLGGDPGLEAEWFRELPFELTPGQEEVIGIFGEELGNERPMRRLLMGEVGSGKTVLAAFAALRAFGSGTQAALMAPTEVLAEQHHATLTDLLGRAGVEPFLLTGSTGVPERELLFDRLVGGQPTVVVGTHALLGERVEFARLGVAVVDEEHRFGVRQRTELDGHDPGAPAVHRLHLSATPIPRTLALTAWGDLDLSELRDLPGGRRPVETTLLDEGGREEAFDAIRREVAAGRQAFVVCPLVEESEAVQARAAEVEARRLAKGELAGLEVGLLHGRMTQQEKAVVMDRFLRREIDVLVATTVIEVGIDVPNATVIVIEGAESFGLAQLHQLRGRVGRGDRPGRCYLVAGRPGGRAMERLSRLAGEPDGFRVAELDLELRGEGELAGTRQHGLPRFRAASLPADRELLFAARSELERLLGSGERIDGPLLGPSLAEALERFGPEGVTG